VDIDPRRIAESRDNARQAGVADRIEFRTEDLLTTEIGRARLTKVDNKGANNKRFYWTLTP
jgi:23S rRNA G2445 N2-methylase RlmL